ncbi:MAG: GNAT family N-acetyltransferase [Bacteroidales bacterium]
MIIQTEIRGFTLKTTNRDDTGIIISYIKKLAEYERLLDKVVVTETELQQYLFGERAYAEVLLAYENDECVGFALFFHNFSTFAGKPGLYLEDVYIDPEHRGKGYGKVILKHLASVALQRGCARFEWSVLNWNTPAIEFYRALGAVPMEDWTVFRMDTEAMRILTNE